MGWVATTFGLGLLLMSVVILAVINPLQTIQQRFK